MQFVARHEGCATSLSGRRFMSDQSIKIANASLVFTTALFANISGGFSAGLVGGLLGSIPLILVLMLPSSMVCAVIFTRYALKKHPDVNKKEFLAGSAGYLAMSMVLAVGLKHGVFVANIFIAAVIIVTMLHTERRSLSNNI